jgi:hypothetical protein
MATLFSMKSTSLACMLALVLLAGCATTKPAVKDTSSTPETVMVTYHVKLGGEAALEQLLTEAWTVYRENHLVLAQPHIILRDQERGGKTRIVEIFTWASHEAPDHAPASVKAIWGKMMSLCEPRDGHIGLEGGEMQIISK